MILGQEEVRREKRQKEIAKIHSLIIAISLFVNRSDRMKTGQAIGVRSCVSAFDGRIGKGFIRHDPPNFRFARPGPEGKGECQAKRPGERWVRLAKFHFRGRSPR